MTNAVKKATDLYNECKKACEDGDDEVAHSREDSLMEFAIDCVITQAPGYMEVCLLAASTSKLDFARWCA